MTYRERRERRAERLHEWASRRAEKAEAARSSATAIMDVIPFGQPILVGHHSERRHRRDLARIDSGIRQSIEHANKAEDMSRRADGIESQLDSSIYSDDPDAIERLEERIAALEAEREERNATVDAYNASVKAGSPDLSLLDEDSQRTIRAFPGLYGNGRKLRKGDFTGNLSANIKRNRDRLEGLKRDKERAERAESAGGVLIEARGSYVIVTFADKPPRDVLDSLKAAGFRWGSGSWIGSADSLPEGIK